MGIGRDEGQVAKGSAAAPQAPKRPALDCVMLGLSLNFLHERQTSLDTQPKPSDHVQQMNHHGDRHCISDIGYKS